MWNSRSHIRLEQSQSWKNSPPTFPVLRSGCSPHSTSSHYSKETHIWMFPSAWIKPSPGREPPVGNLTELQGSCPLSVQPGPCKVLPTQPPPPTSPAFGHQRKPIGASYACCDPFISVFVLHPSFGLFLPPTASTCGSYLEDCPRASALALPHTHEDLICRGISTLFLAPVNL